MQTIGDKVRLFFSRLIDFIIPDSLDSVKARELSEEKLRTLMRLSVGPHVWIYSIFPYREPTVRAMIRSIKYRNETKPLEALGRIIAEELLEILADKYAIGGWQQALLVPIPSSQKRLRERGYSQAKRVSEQVAIHLEHTITHAPELLEREERESQTRFSFEKRKENSNNVFSVPHTVSAAAQGVCIILLDDVVESGSTLLDARRALLEAGAKDVIAIALAR